MIAFVVPPHPVNLLLLGLTLLGLGLYTLFRTVRVTIRRRVHYEALGVPLCGFDLGVAYGPRPVMTTEAHLVTCPTCRWFLPSIRREPLNATPASTAPAVR